MFNFPPNETDRSVISHFSLVCLTWPEISPHLLCSGAEGQQEAEPLGALGRKDPRWLRDQPRVHLGGPAGPQRVPSARPARASERHPEENWQPATQQHAAAAGGRREEGETRLKEPQIQPVFASMWLMSDFRESKECKSDFFSKSDPGHFHTWSFSRWSHLIHSLSAHNNFKLYPYTVGTIVV